MLNDGEGYEQADVNTPESLMLDAERVNLALDCVNKLPGARMRVAMLMKVAGYKHEDIGKAMGVSKVVVDNYIIRARKKIIEMMGDYDEKGIYEDGRQDGDDSFDGRMQRIAESIEQVLKNGESDPGEEV